MIEHFPSDKVLHTPPPQYRGTSEDLSPTARTRPDKKTVPLESRRAPTSSSTRALTKGRVHLICLRKSLDKSQKVDTVIPPSRIYGQIQPFSDENKMRPSLKPAKQPND